MTGDRDRLDDYSLVRVPERDRRSWLSVAVQRFGQVSSFQQFIVGAVLGYGMTFGNAVLAITVGSVMLEIITILLGVAGVREGLSTSVLARWSGFGRKGSALVGLLIAVSLAGWFGVQNGSSHRACTTCCTSHRNGAGRWSAVRSSPRSPCTASGR